MRFKSKLRPKPASFFQPILGFPHSRSTPKQPIPTSKVFRSNGKRIQATGGMCRTSLRPTHVINKAAPVEMGLTGFPQVNSTQGTPSPAPQPCSFYSHWFDLTCTCMAASCVTFLQFLVTCTCGRIGSVGCGRCPCRVLIMI